MKIHLASVLALTLYATAAPSPAESTSQDTPAEVRLEALGHGWMLTDSEGMTLYTSMKDPLGGMPQCAAECIATWSPLEAPAQVEPPDEWSVIEREDGLRQWTFRGKPLYRYNRDRRPGDMNGDEFLQQWYVAIKPLPLPPGFATYKTQYGQLLVDQRNMTLYTSDADPQGASACDGACARTWPPVEAWWRARSPLPEWSVIERADGTRQWAFRGRPLYRYAGDYAPGEIAGNSQDSWSAVVLEAPPPLPEWITFQKSDAGELLADANGKTLYAHDLTKPRAFGIGIGRDMATPHLWTPVYAEGNSPPLGHWSVVRREDGAYQWAYKGMSVYVHKRDTAPGDLNGQRSSDRVWRTIMRDGQSMPGTGR